MNEKETKAIASHDALLDTHTHVYIYKGRH